MTGGSLMGSMTTATGMMSAGLSLAKAVRVMFPEALGKGLKLTRHPVGESETVICDVATMVSSPEVTPRTS